MYSLFFWMSSLYFNMFHDMSLYFAVFKAVLRALSWSRKVRDKKHTHTICSNESSRGLLGVELRPFYHMLRPFSSPVLSARVTKGVLGIQKVFGDKIQHKTVLTTSWGYTYTLLKTDRCSSRNVPPWTPVLEPPLFELTAFGTNPLIYTGLSILVVTSTQILRNRSEIQSWPLLGAQRPTFPPSVFRNQSMRGVHYMLIYIYIYIYIFFLFVVLCI